MRHKQNLVLAWRLLAGRVLLAVLLCLISDTAFAQTADTSWASAVEAGGWNVGTFASDGSEMWLWRRAHPAISPEGYRRLWVRVEIQNTNKIPNGALSMMTLQEFDCAGGRQRVISYTDYALRNMNGNVASSSDSKTEWSYVGPGTLADEWRQVVCP